MPIPLAIPIAIGAAALIGGLVQLYNGEEGRKASKKVRKEIEAMFEKVKEKLPNFDMSITDPPELIMERLQQPEFSKHIAKIFTPEDYKKISNFAPSLAPLVKEVAPETIKENEHMKRGTAAQIAALDKLTEIGKGGYNPEYAEAISKAGRESSRSAESSRRSLQDIFGQRGIHNSGLEFASAQDAQHRAMDRQALANQAAASAAYRNQLDAIAKSGELGHNLYDQQEGTQGKNANIINSYNQRLANNAQNIALHNNGLQNSAAEKNFDLSQNLANANVGQRNAATQDQLHRELEAQKLNHQNSQQQFQNQAFSNAQHNDLLTQLAQWKANEKANQNAIQQQKFQNEFDIVNGQAGNANARAQNILQNAADKNSAVSGITGALTNTALLAGMLGKEEGPKWGGTEGERDPYAPGGVHYNSGSIHKNASLTGPQQSPQYFGQMSQGEHAYGGIAAMQHGLKKPMKITQDDEDVYV